MIDFLFRYEVWTGLLVGLFFGYVLQRGKLCFNAAIREIKFSQDNFLMKGIALALGLSAIIFTLMANLNLINLNPTPFMPWGNIIGGLLFGIGMVVAGGCAGSVTYRVGEGLTTAWIAAIFFGLSAAAARFSFLRHLVDLLRGPVYLVEGDGMFYRFGRVGPTIANLLEINPWIPTVIFSALMLWYAFGTKTTERSYSSPWNWKTIGIMTTIVAAAAYFTRQVGGLLIYAPWVSLYRHIVAGHFIGWGGMLIVGIIVGALISAVAYKEFKVRMPEKPGVYTQMIIGGSMMGFGATLAGGCNIGHFLTGVPQLAFGSLLATVFFFVGSWAGYYFMYARR
ncbi:YeeE/YedE family protein [Candidatus Acetothermia bacterium]|nr:YeeE/YedE family protein [Candidatus Acetothermia bacterium]MCI2427927.1 YeeE/YedE family protein [Candidatus Acetothermia bacterium]MCI2427969.1 YeeE/YedE family protein [Candidatus Acetothermia bacterium]